MRGRAIGIVSIWIVFWASGMFVLRVVLVDVRGVFDEEEVKKMGV